MSRSLSYQFERSEPKEGDEGTNLADPIVLDLTGDEKDRITCKDSIDGLVVLQFAAAMEPGIAGSERARGILKVIKGAVEPADWSKFERLVGELQLEVTDLIGIGSDLIDAYLNHPTIARPTSSGGPQESGTGSTENSSSEESTTNN